MFDLLIAVSGVGPQARARRAVGPAARRRSRARSARSRSARLVAIPGIGRKTAERLVVELRDKLESLAVAAAARASRACCRAPSASRMPSRRSCVSGYTAPQAQDAVRKVDEARRDASLEDLVRRALALLGKSAARATVTPLSRAPVQADDRTWRHPERSQTPRAETPPRARWPIPSRSPRTVQEEPRLRPLALDEFVGQPAIREQLRIFLEAAKRRGEALDHVLFHGPPGLGKTTLATILAHELGVEITHTSGPVIERPGDLAGLLTNLGPRGILFVDEIHRLSPVVEEYLYPALEDFTLDILLDRGPSARSLKINLERFTLVGATTRSGLLSSPLRARFGVTLRLDYYARRRPRRASCSARPASSASRSSDDAAVEIARRARAARRGSRTACCAACATSRSIKADGRVTLAVTREALRLLEVDERGLDEMDRRLLEALITKYQGGPVGLNTLAVVVGEEVGDARGRLRAVPDPGGLHQAHRARPRGHAARVRAPRPRAAIRRPGVPRVARGDGQPELPLP